MEGVALITLISLFDNGAQMQWLAEALREHTDLDAIHLNIHSSYLDYPADLRLSDYDTAMKRLELKDRLRDTEFYVFSEFLPNSSQLKPLLVNLGLYRKIHPRNTIIRLSGSHARANADLYLMAWLRKDWMFTGTTHDWTHFGNIGRIAPTRNIVPVDKIPKPNPPKDKVRVAFAPTKKAKGVDEFSRVMDSLMKEYPDKVEAVPIVNKSWEESIKIKAGCNVTFDQFLVGTYANSAIESMSLSHVVVSRIDLWTQMLYPDLPVINVSTERDLYEKLKWLIEDPKEIKKIGKKGKEFIEKYHTPEKVAKSWEILIKHVKTT
jgi:glycosyltransferase involved in cell wall biosynthesis